jgi:hypothetical protein
MPETTPRRGIIICFGIYFWYPLAGVTYQMLHYLLPLREMGFDVYYIEDSYRDVYDPFVQDYTYDYSNVIRHLAPVLDEYGFKDRWACRDGQGTLHGMSEERLAQLYRDADASLNLCGGHEVRDEHKSIRKRIYVESDPFSLQVRVAKGDAGSKQFLDDHHLHFTFGERMGEPDCLTPATGHDWMPTRQPVHMPLWTSAEVGGETYNTITTWQNKTPPLEFKGELYHWTKDIEFRKYIDLPLRRPGCGFELATGVDDAVRDELKLHGWKLKEAMDVSMDHRKYRDYILQSRGEFTVAREQYYRPNTGWFSDRSVSYLAAGRPVITGETGFSRSVPSGRGLMAYRTMDDILAAVDSIESDYAGHCRAAREVASEYFCSMKVMRSLLTRSGLL